MQRILLGIAIGAVALISAGACETHSPTPPPPVVSATNPDPRAAACQALSLSVGAVQDALVKGYKRFAQTEPAPDPSTVVQARAKIVEALENLHRSATSAANQTSDPELRRALTDVARFAFTAVASFQSLGPSDLVRLVALADPEPFDRVTRDVSNRCAAVRGA